MKFMKAITKWTVRGIGVALLVFIALGVVTFLNSPTTPPESAKAPWAVQTYSNDKFKIPSRVYIAEQAVIEDGVVSIENYWSFDGKNYIYHRGTKSFPPKEYGGVDVIRRRD